MAGATHCPTSRIVRLNDVVVPAARLSDLTTVVRRNICESTSKDERGMWGWERWAAVFFFKRHGSQRILCPRLGVILSLFSICNDVSKGGEPAGRGISAFLTLCASLGSFRSVQKYSPSIGVKREGSENVTSTNPSCIRGHIPLRDESLVLPVMSTCVYDVFMCGFVGMSLVSLPPSPTRYTGW